MKGVKENLINSLLLPLFFCSVLSFVPGMMAIFLTNKKKQSVYSNYEAAFAG